MSLSSGLPLPDEEALAHGVPGPGAQIPTVFDWSSSCVISTTALPALLLALLFGESTLAGTTNLNFAGFDVA